MTHNPWFHRLLCSLAALLVTLAQAAPAWAQFSLPPLPYAPEALEPAIDATTMTIHHDRHHGTYVANLNGQIKANPKLANLNLDALQGQISQFPAAVRNNGGGHWNHSQFWAVMAPRGRGAPPPKRCWRRSTPASAPWRPCRPSSARPRRPVSAPAGPG